MSDMTPDMMAKSSLVLVLYTAGTVGMKQLTDGMIRMFLYFLLTTCINSFMGFVEIKLFVPDTLRRGRHSL